MLRFCARRRNKIWSVCKAPQQISSRCIIDFSSDVRTVPTDSMRLAMYNAEVGDDQIDADPTVNALQQRVSKLFDKESALFVPSGVMGNLISLLTHCNERQSEMILGDMCHIHLSEAGNSAFIAGVHSRLLRNQSDGTLSLDDITKAIRWASSYDPHSPKTKLLCLENTHNRLGGYCLTPSYMQSVHELLCKYSSNEYLGYKIPIHLDGARLFNAAIALNCEIAELVKYCDSINICFSKGLGCPIGSMLIGDAAFIQSAKRYRKALGGAMRQTGVIAATAMVALDEIVPKLASDHENAKYVYSEIKSMDFHGLTLYEPETNIFMFAIEEEKFGMNHADFVEHFTKHEIRIHQWEKCVYRFVFHHQHKQEEIDTLLSCFKLLKATNDIAAWKTLDSE